MTGLRERKKERTRRELEETAHRLFRERGYEQTTIEDIAEVVGVSARTFFRYFDSKEAVLLGDWRAQLGELSALIMARPKDESLLDSARALSVGIATMMEADRERHRFVKKIVASSPHAGDYERTVLLPEFERTLVNALAQRMSVDPAEDMRPTLAAAVGIAAMHTAKVRWTTDESASLVALVNEAFEALEGIIRS